VKLAEMLTAAEATFAGRQPLVLAPALRNSKYVHAGQLFASAEPYDISTILGSCVSVCLWEPQRGIGGINHYMLPWDASSSEASPRFADFAVRKLIETLERLGANRNRLKAKLFGGASVLTPQLSGGLGMRNIAAGHSLLAEAGIPIVDEDTGGERGRKLVFRSDDGSASVRRL
jgi:chemotaxis protein CheD